MADSTEIERLYFQNDNLYHQRVTIFLLAETVFFGGAVAVWGNFPVYYLFCVLGFFVTIILAIPNIRSYWRVLWIIKQMEESSQVYKDYIVLKNIEDRSFNWWPISLCLIKKVKEDGALQQRFWLNTGWLYSWGLGIIALCGWLGLLIIRVPYKFIVLGLGVLFFLFLLLRCCVWDSKKLSNQETL